MRALLDGLYRVSGGLAAMFLAGIAVLILAQIIGRFFDILVPSANDFAGFCLAASSFLALAYTFRGGGHIRVSLVLQRLPAKARRGCEIGSLLIAACLISYFAWQAILLTRDSWKFGDLSDGLIAVPLWIPQTAMAFGLIVLAVALIDTAVAVIRGEIPPYQGTEQLVPAKDDQEA